MERFHIELNDPTSCTGVISIAETFCPNYPFQPVCFTSLQSLIILTATSQSAQCYISERRAFYLSSTLQFFLFVKTLPRA